MCCQGVMWFGMPGKNPVESPFCMNFGILNPRKGWVIFWRFFFLWGGKGRETSHYQTGFWHTVFGARDRHTGANRNISLEHWGVGVEICPQNGMLFGRGVQGILYLEHLKMLTGIHDLMACRQGHWCSLVCQGSPDRIETLPWWFGVVTYWSRVDLREIIPFR